MARPDAPADGLRARPRRVLWRALRALGLMVAALAVVLLVLIVAWRIVPPVSTLMLARWVTGQPVDRRYVPIEAIAPQLAAAVIVSEDARFCSHRGVDWDALSEVLSDEDGPSRGASTLTMQTVKNLFLWPSRSYLRKALEVPLALLLDAAWPKRRIMEVYMNIAEWGPGIFGAEAAAQRLFGRPALALGVREVTLLAAALPNPAVRNAARPGRHHARLAAVTGARLAGAGGLTACLGGGAKKSVPPG